MPPLRVVIYLYVNILPYIYISPPSGLAPNVYVSIDICLLRRGALQIYNIKCQKSSILTYFLRCWRVRVVKGIRVVERVVEGLYKGSLKCFGLGV